jgi:head-tail adaptor
MTEAGDLNRRISIQEPIETFDVIGGSSKPTWQNLPGCGSVPTRIRYYYSNPRAANNSETFSGDQLQPSLIAIFTVRYRPSVNISAIHRILYGVREFNIRNVQTVDEGGQWIDLHAEELQAEGSTH